MLNKFSKTALDLKYSVFSSNWVGFTLYASVHHAFIEMRTMAERTIQGVIFINCLKVLKGAVLNWALPSVHELLVQR